jgi:hypothetical protein
MVSVGILLDVGHAVFASDSYSRMSSWGTLWSRRPLRARWACSGWLNSTIR